MDKISNYRSILMTYSVSACPINEFQIKELEMFAPLVFGKTYWKTENTYIQPVYLAIRMWFAIFVLVHKWWVKLCLLTLIFFFFKRHDCPLFNKLEIYSKLLEFVFLPLVFGWHKIKTENTYIQPVYLAIRMWFIFLEKVFTKFENTKTM